MEDWNERLKQARINAGFTLKKVTTHINITQQSLIEYEKGTIYPKIDMLVELCNLYNVRLNYIVYGNKNGLELENNLQKEIEVLVSMLIFKKIKINNDIIKIEDKELAKYLNYFNMFINENDKHDLKNIEKIIQAINKLR